MAEDHSYCWRYKQAAKRLADAERRLNAVRVLVEQPAVVLNHGELALAHDRIRAELADVPSGVTG